MKKILLISAALAAVFLSGCKKQEKDEQKKEEPITVGINVSDIVDNKATVKVTVLTGSANSGKVVAGALLSQTDIDFEQEILLINYVEKAGTAVTLPYEITLEKTIAGQDYISAVIVYDENGRAVTSAYEIWTAEGLADGWSQQNDAGSLNPNQW